MTFAVTSIQKMEQHETEKGEKKSHLCYYYYINYKLFVNVVKYKLDQMRKKIEGEERRVRILIRILHVFLYS